MKNVVSKSTLEKRERAKPGFEKELNPDLIKMAMYYGFTVNVTNCFKGNEKGHVENRVKVLRNQTILSGIRIQESG